MRLLMPPVLLHYYITYRCNCKCRFCDIWHAPEYDRSQFADLNAVNSNLTEARKLGTRFVDFTGGEPLLHPQLPDMLSIAKSLGYTTSITTNGLLYVKQARQLRGKIDLLHFSIDSLHPEQHDAIRGKNVLNALMQALDTALELGEKPDLLFTTTLENIDALPALVRFAQSLRLMLIVNPVFSHQQEHELTSQALDKLDEYRHTPWVYINKAFHMLRRAGGNDPANPRCRVTQSTIVISPDNHLLLPCFHHYQKRIQLNNNLLSIYKSEQVRAAQSMAGRYDFCRGCVLNCYMDPSFLYKIDSLMLDSLWSKSRYAWYKYIVRPLITAGPEKNRPSAAELAAQILEETT